MTLKTAKTWRGDSIRLSKNKMGEYVVMTNNGFSKRKTLFNEYDKAYSFYKDMVRFYK